jgi:hypothetical protein
MCTASAASCTGVVSITATVRRSSRRIIRSGAAPVGPVTIARAAYALAAGASAALRIELNRTGRRLLERFYRLDAELSVTGTETFAQPVTFAYPRIPLTLSYDWNSGRSGTEMVQLTLTGVPAGARAVIGCRGGGCAFTQRTIRRPRSALRVAPLFGSRLLAPGAVVEVLVIEAGHVGDAVLFRIRTAAPPRPEKLCLPPGARRPLACA